MKLKSIIPACATLIFASSAAAFSTCDRTGVGQQQVLLNSGFDLVKSWTVTDTAPKDILLPNGFHLGVGISPAPREIYLRGGSAPIQNELVTITLYDMTTPTPRVITHTYGPSNSVQGYGPQGGADSLFEAGPDGIRLILSRPICVTVADTPKSL